MGYGKHDEWAETDLTKPLDAHEAPAM